MVVAEVPHYGSGIHTSSTRMLDDGLMHDWTRRSAIGGGIGLLGLSLSGCLSRKSGFRYQITLEVEADGVRKTASSVQEFRWTVSSVDVPLSNKISAYNLGDGVVLDLGSRGVLASTFLLRAMPGEARGGGWLPAFDDRPVVGSTWPAGNVLASRIPETAYLGTPASWLALSKMGHSASVELDPLKLPLLVVFPDRLNPRRVEIFDPILEDGLIRLVRASMAITSEPMTRGTADVSLPWLKRMRDERPDSGQYLDNGYPNSSFAANIANTDISRWWKV